MRGWQSYTIETVQQRNPLGEVKTFLYSWLADEMSLETKTQLVLVWNLSFFFIDLATMISVQPNNTFALGGVLLSSLFLIISVSQLRRYERLRIMRELAE